MFQSHNGAIAACLKEFQPATVPMVSIPQWCDCCDGDENDELVIRIVSIPQWCDCCAAPSPARKASMLCFNPTMVRLLPVVVFACLHQFLFQSHNGAIAAQDANQWAVDQLGFNPTMVRLLRFGTVPANAAITMFQSHNGAIAAC